MRYELRVFVHHSVEDCAYWAGPEVGILAFSIVSISPITIPSFAAASQFSCTYFRYRLQHGYVAKPISKFRL